MLISTGDIFIAGKVSVDAVAALGVANGVVIPIFLMGMGLLHGISPRLAQKRGEGENIDRYLLSTLGYSCIVSILAISVLRLLLPVLPYLGFDSRLLPLVTEYIRIFSFSFIGAYIFQGVREFLQAREIVLLPNLFSLISVGLNLVLNYIFAFGELGVPAMGFSGLAIASILTRLFLAACVLILVRRSFTWYLASKEFFISLVKLSIPISLSIFLEVSAFSFASLIIATISSQQVAAHTIVLNLASLAFMIPLSISIALSVKSGNAFGSKNYILMKQWLVAGFKLSLSFALGLGFVYYVFSSELLSLFTSDSKLIMIGIPLLGVVALFQLVDAVQVVLAGFLRGMNITKLPLYVSFLGYWVIGLCGGSILTFYFDLKALGMWSGLALSLGVAALLLSLITRYYFKPLYNMQSEKA